MYIDTLARTLATRRGILGLLGLLGALPLAAGLSRLGIPSAKAVALPADGPIMSRYCGHANNGVDAYRPRGFADGLLIRDAFRDTTTPPVTAYWKVTNAGAYAGWDVFALGGVTGSYAAQVTNTWVTFTADRPTTVGYVHRAAGSPPTWIAADGWVQSGTVVSQLQDPRASIETRPVYRKSFPAGLITIKSPSQDGTSKMVPWLLFAEADGTPSVAPLVPTGQSVPVPNMTCPTWVHDQYKAKNSNWPTWHPPQDPKYWCYFNHDHGSNPKHIYGVDLQGYPRYGEVASFGDMTENHWGHKNYVVEYPHENVVVMFVHHFGTTGLGRVNTCLQQHHLLEVHIRSLDRQYTYAILRFMADFGLSLGNLIQDQTEGPINPDSCPNGNATAGYTGPSPSRQIPIGNFGNPPDKSNAYEPWIFAVDRYLSTLGIGGNFVFNTVDPLTTPVDITGNTANENLYRSGTGRFFTPNTMRFVNPGHGNAQGYWWTDALATEIVSSTTPAAVRQYFNPTWDGFAAIPPFTPNSAHQGGPNVSRWGDMTIPVPTGMSGDFEGSITAAHGPN